MYNIIAQTIGYIAMAISISSFALKKSNTIVLMQTLCNGLFIVHFLMLGAYSGCGNVGIMVASNTLLYLSMRGSERASWKGWKWLCCIASVVVCILTYVDMFSILPCIATIAFILTGWSKRANVIRIGKISLVGFGWTFYNWHVRSYSAVLSESVGMLSALFSLLYYSRKYRKKEVQKLMREEGTEDVSDYR